MAVVAAPHIDIVPWSGAKSSSSGLARLAIGGLTGALGVPISGGVNDFIAWDVPLTAGTWTITVIYAKLANAGIMTGSLGGVDLSPTVDAYAAVTAYDNVIQWTGVVVANGLSEFRLRAASKNVSATDYFVAPQLVTFTNQAAPTNTFTCVGPSRIDIIPYGNWDYSAGNTPTRTYTASAISGGVVSATSSATNEIGWYVPLTAGTWALDILAPTGPDSGILTITLDGASVGTVDTYSAGAVWNLNNSFTGINVPTSKIALLKVAVPTKNGASVGNRYYLQHVALRKTA